MNCPCPNPTNCSPTYCHFTEADLTPGLKVQMLGPEEPDPSAALIARANEHIRKLEARSLPLHVKAWDWVGNLPHKAKKYARSNGFDSPVSMAVVAVLLVAGCVLVALTALPVPK